MKPQLSTRFVHLMHLSAIVESGSINRAALLLGISQPALTRSISRLEETLNLQLLVRTSKGVTPTDFARVLLHRLRKANAELLRAEDELRALKGAVEGTIVCGAGAITTYFLLPVALDRFRTLHPQIHVRLIEGHTPALLDGLRQGTIDLLIGSKVDEKDNSDLEAEALLKERIEVYARRAHPALGARKQRLADLIANARWVLPGSTIYLHRLISAELERRSAAWPNTFIETTSIQTMRWLVKNSDFLTISSSLVFAAELKDRSVQVVSGDWSFPVTQTVLYRNKESPAPAAISAFVKILKQAARHWPSVSA